MNLAAFEGVTHNYHHLKLRVHSHYLLLIFLVLAKFKLLIWFLQSRLLYNHKNWLWLNLILYQCFISLWLRFCFFQLSYLLFHGLSKSKISAKTHAKTKPACPIFIFFACFRVPVQLVHFYKFKKFWILSSVWKFYRNNTLYPFFIMFTCNIT